MGSLRTCLANIEDPELSKQKQARHIAYEKRKIAVVNEKKDQTCTESGCTSRQTFTPTQLKIHFNRTHWHLLKVWPEYGVRMEAYRMTLHRYTHHSIGGIAESTVASRQKIANAIAEIPELGQS